MNWRNVISITICSAALMLTVACDETDDDNLNMDNNITVSNKNDLKQSAFADELTTGNGFTFTAKDNWTASVKASGSTSGGNSASWVTLKINGQETYSGSSGSYTVQIVVEENYTGAKREATVEIVCGSDRITVTVSQDGKTKNGEAPAKKPTELTNDLINKSNAVLAAGVYQVKNNLTLNGGNNLTISPGVVIRFDKGRNIEAKVNAKIIAKGTSSQPVTFTSSQQNPEPGDWGGLYLYGKDNEFEWCVFEYGSSDHSAILYGMIYLENSTASITNCTFSNSKYAAVSLRSPDSRFIRFDNNTITNCGENVHEGFPIAAWGGGAGFNNLSVMGSNNTINTAKGIGVGSGKVTKDITVKKYVYIICDNFSIEPPTGSGATFTIEAGTTFKMEVDKIIEVKERAKIIAIGSEANPITFTSAKNNSTRAPGDWNGIYITQSNGSEFKHCVFEYGSNSISAVWYGMLFMDDCKASVMNCIFRHSKYSAVSYIHGGGGFTEFDYNTFIDCGENEPDAFPIVGWGWGAGFMGLSKMGANNTISGDRGIGVGSGTVNASMTLGKYLYTVCDHVEITQPSGTGATLTILPGAKLLFAKNTHLTIGSGGKLVAEGTASDKIIFTGSAKDKGWWNGIMFNTNNALRGSVLSNCEISYGGAGTSYGDNGNINCIDIGSGVLTIKNCTITHSRAWGIYYYASNAFPSIQNNTYSNNGPHNNSNTGGEVIGHY